MTKNASRQGTEIDGVTSVLSRTTPPSPGHFGKRSRLSLASYWEMARILFPHRNHTDRLRKLYYAIRHKPTEVDFLFIHINKTGGSSITKALGIRKFHRTAADLRELVGDAFWNRSFKFAFVRNPWDRVVSHYHYGVRTGGIAGSGGAPSFSEWIEVTFEEGRREVYNRSHERDLFFANQRDWLNDENDRIIVDFVGRFESLEDDFEQVARVLGVDPELPHLNASRRKEDYRTYYTDRTASIVGEYFRRDVETFGYTF